MSPVMGHRNWVVVADLAYPAQSRAGIETIATGVANLVGLQESADVWSVIRIPDSILLKHITV